MHTRQKQSRDRHTSQPHATHVQKQINKSSLWDHLADSNCFWILRLALWNYEHIEVIARPSSILTYNSAMWNPNIDVTNRFVVINSLVWILELRVVNSGQFKSSTLLQVSNLDFGKVQHLTFSILHRGFGGRSALNMMASRYWAFRKKENSHLTTP